MIKGTLLATLSGILFGLLGYLGMQLLNMGFSIENMLFWRFLMASVFIACFLWPIRKGRKNRKNLVIQPKRKTSLIKTLLLGALCYAGNSSLYFIASGYIGTGTAMVIFYCFPVFVMCFSWFFDHKKPGVLTGLSLFIILMGLFLLHKQENATRDVFGIILAVLSGAFYAVFVYNSKDQSKDIDPQLLTFLVCLGNALTFFIWSIMTNSFIIPSELSTWLYLFALGILATALPIQCLLLSLKYISPVKASVLSVLEPVVTVIIGCLFLQEVIVAPQLFGIVLLLLGAIFIQFDKKKLTQ